MEDKRIQFLTGRLPVYISSIPVWLKHYDAYKLNRYSKFLKEEDIYINNSKIQSNIEVLKKIDNLLLEYKINQFLNK